MRRIGMVQFIADSRQDRYGCKQPRQKVNMAGEHEVVQRTSVRHDDLHAHKPS